MKRIVQKGITEFKITDKLQEPITPQPKNVPTPPENTTLNDNVWDALTEIVEVSTKLDEFLHGKYVCIQTLIEKLNLAGDYLSEIINFYKLD